MAHDEGARARVACMHAHTGELSTLWLLQVVVLSSNIQAFPPSLSSVSSAINSGSVWLRGMVSMESVARGKRV